MSGARIPDRPLKSPEVAKSGGTEKSNSGRGNDVAGALKKNPNENAKIPADKFVKAAETNVSTAFSSNKANRGKIILSARNPAARQNGKSAVQSNRSSVSSAFPQNRLSAGDFSGNMREARVEQIPARELFNQSAAAMGFPKDALSAAVLAFARFFSQSITPALMGNLRREILSSGKSSSPASAKEKAAVEAETLALISALDKGVVLSPEALEKYAAYFMPAPNSDGDAAFSQEAGEREKIPGAEELEAIASEKFKKDGLLDFLNAIPGGNGQRWLVYPFKITIKGIELNVFIRILKREPVSSEEDGRIIADITGPARQWRCFLRKSAGKVRADIRVYPDCPPEALKLLEKRALRFFVKNSGFGEISVRNGGEFFSWAEDLCGETLPLVNKQV